MLDSYLTCPQDFKNRYLDGVKDTVKSSALEFGQALHLAIKTHFEGGDGTNVFTMYWDSLKNTEMVYYRHDWQALRDLATQKFLPNFFKLHAKKFTNVKLEEQCEMPFMGHTLQGTFDICSDYEGDLTLSDWKTSSREYRKDKIEKNPQLYIYSMLYRHKYGILPKQLQYKVFRKDNGSIQTLRLSLTEELLARQEASIAAIVKSLLWSIATNNWYHTFQCYCEREVNEKNR